MTCSIYYFYICGLNLLLGRIKQEYWNKNFFLSTWLTLKNGKENFVPIAHIETVEKNFFLNHRKNVTPLGVEILKSFLNTVTCTLWLSRHIKT